MKVKDPGFRSSTLVTLAYYVLPDIEHCLSGCVKLAAWQVTDRLTCRMQIIYSSTSQNQTHVQYQKGTRKSWAAKAANTQRILTS